MLQDVFMDFDGMHGLQIANPYYRVNLKLVLYL